MVIADTGFWLALANRSDRHHTRAVDALRTLQEPLITTWPVLTETCHLLVSRLGVDAQIKLMASLEAGAFELFQLEAGHLPRIHRLMADYADLPMDLADASLVVLAESLGRGLILSTDQRDFHTYRWKSHKPFENILFAEE